MSSDAGKQLTITWTGLRDKPTLEIITQEDLVLLLQEAERRAKLVKGNMFTDPDLLSGIIERTEAETLQTRLRVTGTAEEAEETFDGPNTQRMADYDIWLRELRNVAEYVSYTLSLEDE